MNHSITAISDLTGFYELNSEGIILYSRIKRDGEATAAAGLLTGKDFFTEFLDCRNADALRRRFLGFVSGKSTTETFIFGCEIGGTVIPLRVMLVHVSQVSRKEPGSLFYIDIKAG